MTSDGKKDGGTTGGRKHRAVKPVTIDLKATEVEKDTAKAKAPDDKAAKTEAPAAKAEPETKAEAPAAKAEPDAASKPDPKAGAKPAEKPAEPAAAKPAAAKPAAAKPDAAKTTSAKTEAAQPKPEKPEPAKPTEARSVFGGGPAPVKADQEKSTFRVVISAIVGGGIALAIYFAVETAGMLPFGPTARLAELRGDLDRAAARIAELDQRQGESVGTAQLASVESRVAAIEAAAQADRDALGPISLADRLTAIETGIGEGRNGVEAVRGELQALSARLSEIAGSGIAAIESRIDNVAAAAAGDISAARDAAASQAERIAALIDEITTVRERLTSGAAGAEIAIATVKDELAGLSTRLEAALATAETATNRATAALSAAETAAASAAAETQFRSAFETFAAETRIALAAVAPLRNDIARLDLAGWGERFAMVEESLRGLAGQVATLETGADDLTAEVSSLRQLPETVNADLAAVRAEIGAAIEAVKTDLSAARAATDSTMAALDQRLAAAETASRHSATWTRSAAVIAVSALQNAAAGSKPFAGELSAVAEIAGTSEPVEALRPYAESGVATMADLAAKMAEMTAAWQARETGDAGGDILSQLWGSARDVVRIRPVGAVDGKAADAVLSRIKAALAAGDLTAALAEWEKLPEAAKSAFAEWHEAADARARTDRLVAATAQNVLSSPEARTQ